MAWANPAPICVKVTTKGTEEDILQNDAVRERLEKIAPNFSEEGVLCTFELIAMSETKFSYNKTDWNDFYEGIAYSLTRPRVLKHLYIKDTSKTLTLNIDVH